MTSHRTEEWRLRLEATRDAQKRTRFAFLAATIISCAIFIAEYNSTFSWYVHFATRPNFSGTDVTKIAQEELVKNWIDSNRVSASLLGVQFGMSDAAVIGSLGLLILTLWFYYSMRRENHLVGGVLIDSLAMSGDGRQELHSLIFHGVSSYLVFTTVTLRDTPIATLTRDENEDRRVFGIRFTFRMLMFLPAITIAFIIVTDVLSLLLLSYVRNSSEQLASQLSKMEFIHLAIMEGFALVVATATFTLSAKIVAFERATGRILQLYYRQYVKPFEKPLAPGTTSPGQV